MIRPAALALVGVTACGPHTYVVGRVTPAVRLQGSKLQGGELSTSWELDGIGFSLGVNGQQLSRPVFDGTQSRVGGGIAFGGRVSLFGLFKTNHVVDHWFDLGASGTAGGGLIYPARLTTFGELSGGGWVAFGLYPGTGHASLLLELRRVAVSDWDNMTIFTIGISLTTRSFQDFNFAD